MCRPITAVSILTLTALLVACESRIDSPPAEPAVPAEATPPSVITTQSPSGLPAFEDYPVTEMFTGTEAEVDLASHPEAKMFQTRLTEDPGYDNRFAGHYRVVQVGCGTACQGIWITDMIDGSVHFLETASSGVAYRPDSRLIVVNDPAFFEEMLETSTIAEVEEYMEIYGPPIYWLEVDGEFELLMGPRSVDIDPLSGELVAQYCGNNGKVRSAGFSADGKYFVLADAIDGFPLQPEARIFVVEVASNDCVPGGCESMEGDWDSDDHELAVLSRLEESTAPLRQDLGLVPPQPIQRFAPRPLTDEISAYDLGDQTVEVLLRQDSAGDVGERQSSLELEVRAGDTVQQLDSLDRYREGVFGYRLRDLFLSPDGKSIAIVVEMHYEILGHAPSDYCRYMVETVRLD